MNLFSKNNAEQAIYLEYNGDKNGNFEPDPEEIGIKNLEGNGDLPVCIILGNKDDRFTKHSGKNFYKLNAKAILSDEIQGGAIKCLTDYLGVNKDYKIKKEKESIQLDFGPGLNYPNGYLRYKLLKNVGHKFPSGNKKSNYFDGAEILWSFFESHKLLNN